jgi:hypothetical protein
VAEQFYKPEHEPLMALKLYETYSALSEKYDFLDFLQK